MTSTGSGELLVLNLSSEVLRKGLSAGTTEAAVPTPDLLVMRHRDAVRKECGCTDVVTHKISLGTSRLQIRGRETHPQVEFALVPLALFDPS